MASLTTASRRGMLAAALAGCSGATEPTFVTPQLADLKVYSVFPVLRDSGLVVITARPADSTSRPGWTHRLRVYVRSDAGDSEALDLGPSLCGSVPTAYLCTSLLVLMKNGHRAPELQHIIEPIPARLSGVAVNGLTAGVRVFDRGRVDRAIQILSSQPIVRSVERDFVAWAGTPSLAAFAGMDGALPLDFAPPVRGDGKLQSRARDTLRVWYRQPDGTTVARATALP